MKCEYTVTGRYELSVHTESMVVYADIFALPEEKVYDSDTVSLTCGYLGADEATVTWYSIQISI